LAGGLDPAFIDEALAPLESAPSGMSAEDLVRLKHDLAAVVSAEALFSLIDLCGLTPDDAIASLVRTASTITAVAVSSA